MDKIRSKFLLKKIFNNLEEKKQAKIILYNKSLTKKLDYSTASILFLLTEEDFEKQCLKTKYSNILNNLKIYLIKYSIKN